MKKIYVLLFVLFLALVACGSDGGGDDNNSGSNVDTTTQDDVPAWVGTWKIIYENGVDISALNATYILTETSFAQIIPGVCAITGSFSFSENSWEATITSSDCSNIYVGDKLVGNSALAVSEDGQTLTIVSETTNVTYVCVKISSKVAD